LTEQLDLDSMDYLNWMVGINQETGVDIPQRDVSEFLTIAGAVAYLVAHSPEQTAEPALVRPASPTGLAAI
jgi:acyl carrier protein